jgi:hypothetical protein
MKTYQVAKVDILKHIADHGLTVEYTDTKLAFMLKSILETPFGDFTLKSGQSWLEIRRHGEVTRITSFFSVGSYLNVRFFYFSPSEKLAYIDRKLSPTSEEVAALDCSIFGNPLPSFFRPGQGEQADTLSAWLKENFWRMHGVAGLRAQAIERENTKRESALLVAESALSKAKGALLGAESWPTRAEKAKGEALENRNYQIRRQQEAEATFLEYNLENKARALGAGTSWNVEGLRFPAIDEVWTHVDQRANYSATVDPEGKISLSSGIACPFNLSTLANWLRSGCSSQLPTPYGKVNLLQIRHFDTPATLLQAGCHRVNPSDFGPEVAELCKPTHTVQRLSGKPAIPQTDEAAFAAEVERRSILKLAEFADAKRRALHDYAEKLAQIEQNNANFPAFLADKQKQVAEAEAEVEKIKSSPALPPLIGATVENLRALTFRLVSAFVNPAFNQISILSK